MWSLGSETEADSPETGPPEAVTMMLAWPGLSFGETIVIEPGLTCSTPAAGAVGLVVAGGGDEAGGAGGWAGADWAGVGFAEGVGSPCLGCEDEPCRDDDL